VAQLRKDGYDVREAADGWDAWEKIEEAAPDLLIVDDVLPGLSAVELVRLLRSGGISPPLKVAFLVEYEAGLVRAELAGLSRSSVIWKPFDLGALSQAVLAISPR
jgi:CheY-like chemotaxis protein